MRLVCRDIAVSLETGSVCSLSSLTWRGDELLVAPDALPGPYVVHGRAAGITLLHPWANRVRADRFTVPGSDREIVIGDWPEVTRDPAGAAIHGLAVPWTFAAEADGPDAAVVRAAWRTHSAFPFPHELEVRVRVREGGVDVTTTLRASGTVGVPVCFGWHPYFTLPGVPRADWVLAAPGVPAAPLGSRTFDDPVPGGVMSLSGGGRSITVVPDEAAYPVGQLFAPPDRDVVSLEPMTAPVDALRTGEGLRLVEPGAAFEASFAVEIA